MEIMCYNKDLSGTWIIDTIKEYRKAKTSGTEYQNINDYNKAVLEDVKLRVREGIVGKFIILKKE